MAGPADMRRKSRTNRPPKASSNALVAPAADDSGGEQSPSVREAHHPRRELVEKLSVRGDDDSGKKPFDVHPRDLGAVTANEHLTPAAHDGGE